jgi:hypothetical protein
MKIQIPENIDLSRPEQYILTIEPHPERFAFSLCNPLKEGDYFYSLFSDNLQSGAFNSFKDVFFDNDFFTLPFRKVFVINHSPVYTYIPTLLFEEKDKKEYMQFLFSENTGKVLCQTVQKPELTILHEMPEEEHAFFRRIFVGCQIIHHTIPLLSYFQDIDEGFVDVNRMIIHKRGGEMDILCFLNDNLLLCNHFNCKQPDEAVYYSLFIWKQLKFDQLRDFVYIVGDEPDLEELLGNYVRNVIPVEITPEMILSALHEMD